MAERAGQDVKGLGRGAKILLLGGLCLALQQVPISYRIDFFGDQADASLAHLHTGLLLAIAMLDRDRWVVAGCFLITLAGWMARQSYFDGGPSLMLLWGALAYLFNYVWTMACAHLAGWPRDRPHDAVQRHDLLRFAGMGLLLYPVGLALAGSTIVFLSTPEAALSAVFQTFFAKQFGVAVVTLPLVIAWGERARKGARPDVMVQWWWPVLLGGGLAVSLWAAVQVRHALSGDLQPRIVLMDYRFALLAVLAWCMLRLPPRYAMLALAATLLLLVGAVAGTAQYGNTPVGFFNLLHIALEVNILLLAMSYLWLSHRDRFELAERLSGETLRDQVTGLPNLKALRERMARPVPRTELGYLLLDQTDTLVAGFGLDTQAEAMNTTARRLDDMVETYYVGTGQFALLPRAGADPDLWERLIARVEHAEIEVDGQPMRLLPYLGVAAFNGAQRNVVDLAVVTASHLAFEARHHSEVRPRYSEVGDTLVRRSQRKQLQDAAEALACLRNERVALYFQPIRPLEQDEDGARPPALVGEVLCRLADERGDLIPPARFMGPLEAAGRGAELDLAVVRALFRLLRKTPEALPHCRQVGINLTGQSLASMSFQVELRTLLAGAPLPMNAICFEVTETAAISNTAAANHLLSDLRALGCRIAIDDFGTGMQSFARLRELPVDIIKIDGSFVRNVVQHGKDHAVVQASVAVANAFGAETVAEFVEDEETEACLRELGVDYVQGYLYGAPRPLAEVLAEVAAEATALSRP